MNRVRKNLTLYLIACQPIIFVLVWIYIESESTVSVAFRRLGYDAGIYVALYVAAVWTVLVIPAAFIVDRATRGRLSDQRRRLAIILSCGITGYLSTLLFAYILAFPPVVLAFILGCAAYGAFFSISDVGTPSSHR